MESSRPLRPGDRAPDFRLPAANREGLVALSDFRGKRGVLAGLFRGLECPFCRRQITQLSAADDQLRAAGVETLAVVATPRERAALYLRYRPTRVAVLSDPARATHRAFGVPVAEVALGPDGAHEPVVARGNQLVGHFLIDRDGVVRWTHIEGVEHVRAQSHFPAERELLDAARSLSA